MLKRNPFSNNIREDDELHLTFSSKYYNSKFTFEVLFEYLCYVFV